MPSTLAELEALSWSEMKLVFAMTYAQAIRAVVDHGQDALETEVSRWNPETRAEVARALAAVA